MLTHPLAGNLWFGESARKRQEWEQQVLNILSPFQRVYTPHIYNVKVESLCDLDLGYTHISVPKEEENSPDYDDLMKIYMEGLNYIYLGNKCFNHLAMYASEFLTYQNLPIRLFEFSENYHGQEESIHIPQPNLPGLYFTSICIDPKPEAKLMAELVERTADDNLELGGFTLWRGECDIEYHSSENKKEKAMAVLGWAVYKEKVSGI